MTKALKNNFTTMLMIFGGSVIIMAAVTVFMSMSGKPESAVTASLVAAVVLLLAGGGAMWSIAQRSTGESEKLERIATRIGEGDILSDDLFMLFHFGDIFIRQSLMEFRQNTFGYIM